MLVHTVSNSLAVPSPSHTFDCVPFREKNHISATSAARNSHWTSTSRPTCGSTLGRSHSPAPIPAAINALTRSPIYMHTNRPTTWRSNRIRSLACRTSYSSCLSRLGSLSSHRNRLRETRSSLDYLNPLQTRVATLR